MKTKNLFIATLLLAYGLLNAQNNVVVSNSQPTPGQENVLVGNNAGFSINTNFNNTFIGNYSGFNTFSDPTISDSGSFNSFIGTSSGFANKTGRSNTFVGFNSGLNNVTGQTNTLIGSHSNNRNGSGNTFVGHLSGSSTNDGIQNIGIGTAAGRGLISGNYNVLLGYEAGYGISTGINNVCIGLGSGGFLSSNIGRDNILIGRQAGYSLNNSNYNTFIGEQCGENVFGNQNLFLGSVRFSGLNLSTSTLAGSDTHNTIILADGGQQQRFFIHNNGYAGIGLGNNVIPQNRLEISAGLTASGLRMKQLPNSSPSIVNPTNKVLSVNASGDVILVDDKQGSGSGVATTITAGQNIFVTGDSTTGYTISSPNITTTNALVNNTNTMTSTVNGIAANAPIVNSVVNSIASGQLTTTVNGVSSTPVVLPALMEVDGDVTNELQNLGLSGNVLSISNGNSVTLPTYVDTDAQTLSISGNQLTISNGNTVTLPTSGGTNIDTSIYANDGTINEATTTTALNLRTVNMANTNLFFNTLNSSYTAGTRGFGRIYIGNTVNLPILSTATAANLSRYRLLVEGGVLTEKVKVALSTSANWADYVFANDYKLMPLNEVETYVKTNKHLPGVSSAEELVKEGLDLGEMQAKQMEKIEELTLYIIEMNKKLESQAKEIQDLKSKIK